MIFKFTRVRTLSPMPLALLYGLLMLVPQDKAQAHSDFKQFRLDNPGIDRHFARQHFRQDKQVHHGIGEARVNHLLNPNPMPINHGSGAARAQNLHKTIVLHQSRENRLALRSVQLVDNDRIVRLANGVDLDMSSTNENIVLGQNLFKNNAAVEVTVGGETRTFHSGDRVTAAQYLAVKQVIGTGTQLLDIGSDGSAIGGTVNLDGITSNHESIRPI